MRLSHVHALFLAARKLSPTLAARKLSPTLAATVPRHTIDAAVNAHAEPDNRRALPSLLIGPASPARRRAQLLRIASDPLPGRDKANARKWLKRLEHARALAWWRGRAGLTGDALTAYDCASMVDSWRAGPGAAIVSRWRESHIVKFHDAESHKNSSVAQQLVEQRLGLALSPETWSALDQAVVEAFARR